jgi:hypothetical protein
LNGWRKQLDKRFVWVQVWKHWRSNHEFLKLKKPWNKRWRDLNNGNSNAFSTSDVNTNDSASNDESPYRS